MPHMNSDKERAIQINRTKEGYEGERGFNLNFLLQERLNEKAHYDVSRMWRREVWQLVTQRMLSNILHERRFHPTEMKVTQL